MDIPAALIDPLWLYLSWGLWALLMVLAAWQAPWHKLLERDSANVYFATVVVLLVLWNLKAGVLPGQKLHFLGAATLCLMFGWPFALLAVSLLVLGTTLNGSGSWETYALNVLIMGALPIALVHGLLRFSQRHLPHNFFIYIFLNAFWAAVFGVLLAGFTTYALLLASGAYDADQLRQGFLPFLLLVALPEGTLNGIAMTALVAYRPEWVATFHDRWYLRH